MAASIIELLLVDLIGEELGGAESVEEVVGQLYDPMEEWR